MLVASVFGAALSAQAVTAQLGITEGRAREAVFDSFVSGAVSIAGKADVFTSASPQLRVANVNAALTLARAFAAVAFLLAAIGIHGLLAFNVSARSREIGVRIALGARSRDILRMVLGRSALLGGLGVTIGVAVAYAAARSMQSLLAGVDPADITVFAAAVGLSLIMTIAGSLMPAWRAVRVDPLTATRAD